MLYSKKRKFVFVHIYKTAGTSFAAALRPFGESSWKRLLSRVLRQFGLPDPLLRGHQTASELIDVLGRQTFDSCFTFAVVRNPWDWQVSLYNFMQKKPTHIQHEAVKKIGSFDEYIRKRCLENCSFQRIGTQRDFIYSESDELLVDFVGRFESLQADFESICSRIGVSATLPRLNVYNTRPYRQFYTAETREMVSQTFASDISLLGYEF